MIAQCRKKRIDQILTKSISRFGRNTVDMLRSLRDPIIKQKRHRGKPVGMFEIQNKVA